MSFFNQNIRINNKIIGSDRAYIIAEMACAHDGDINKALYLIETAKLARADAIQFELLEPDENVIPQREMNRLLKKLYFNKEEWKKLFEAAKRNELDIFSFAYDYPSLKLSLELNTDAIKLNSSDLMNIELLELTAKSGKPFTLGTGGSTFEEISEALQFIKKFNGSNLILMQGVQNFPTKLEFARINRMKNLQNSFHTLVGYADHTDANSDLSKAVDLVALGMGAKVLEKHITINRKEKGIDHESALERVEFIDYVKRIRDAELAMGPSEITPLIEADYKYRLFQKKYIVAAENLTENQVIERRHLKFLRDTVNTGILPMYIDRVIGKKLNKAKGKYDLIKFEDLH